VATDRSGMIRQWSAGAARLFGWMESEALGRSLDLIVPPDFREAHWKGFRAAIDTAKSQLDGQATNIPVLCKDGQVRPFPARVTFLRDAYGRAAGNVIVYAEPKGGEVPFGPLL
jgi:PAS domain S-box-containing protein